MIGSCYDGECCNKDAHQPLHINDDDGPPSETVPPSDEKRMNSKNKHVDHEKMKSGLHPIATSPNYDVKLTCQSNVNPAHFLATRSLFSLLASSAALPPPRQAFVQRNISTNPIER
jgi:hypothetical protein